MNVVTFTTDFGMRDWFAGTMKGVVLGINPRTGIVDITHEIPAGDIRAGAFALAASCRYFPKGTVHVAVVDPGVGSRRKAIAVRTADYFFVGPDNGILSFALAREKIRAIRQIANEKYFLQPISRTFHGRDVFAPVAAQLSRGLAMHKLGPAQKDFGRLQWPEPQIRDNCTEGEVIFIDRFGNAITNIGNKVLPAEQGREIFSGSKCLGPVREFYQSVPAGQGVVVPGSSGFWEIAVNGGSAAKRFRLKMGSRVMLR